MPAVVRDYVQWGAGPRASQTLTLAAKTRAALHGRHFATTADVRAVAAPALRHRLLLNFKAASEGLTPDAVVAQLVASLPPDESEALDRGPLPRVLGPAHAGQNPVVGA